MDTTTELEMLDAEAMRRIVARLPACQDAIAGSGELAAFWVKPGRHFNTHYRFRGAAGRDIRASAFLMEPRRAQKIADSASEHTCTRQGTLSCARCTTMRTANGLLLQAFPWDYRLPTLSACLDVARVQQATNGLRNIVSAEPRAYRPGMRCQVAYRTADNDMLFGKVSVERRGDGYAFATHRNLAAALAASARTIRVPAAVAYLDGLKLTLIDAAEGTSLHDLIDAGACPLAEVGAAAAALAAFHDVEGVVDDRAYTASDENDLIREWTSLAAELFPGLAASLAECARALAEATPVPVEPRATLHRDFYDKQVLSLDGAAPAVIDMDTAARGDPELDVANFSAHLRFRAIQHGREDLYSKLDDTFLGAYPGRLERRRLDWYRRTTLIRLACNYALRPRWRHVAPRAIALALEA